MIVQMHQGICEFCGEKEIKVESIRGTFYKCINCNTVHGHFHDRNNEHRKAWNGDINSIYDPPCRVCKDRFVGCHDGCIAYLEFKDRIEAARNKRNEKKEFNYYMTLKKKNL